MDSSDIIHIAILGAVFPEIRNLNPILQHAQTGDIRGESFRKGIREGLNLLVGTTGFGKVNAAITTAALLERFSVHQVWHIGCAGAYTEGKLKVGDVLISHDILCGDEGILTETGCLPVQEIGIPVLARKEERFYDHIPAEESLLGWIQGKTPAGYYKFSETPFSSPACPCHDVDSLSETEAPCRDKFFRVAFGPSLTVGMVSGDAVTAGRRFRQFGALAENMEGSGVAQACFRFGVPMLECRGISNTAGDRCKAHWQMETAIAHCQSMVVYWLQNINGDDFLRKPAESR